MLSVYTAPVRPTINLVGTIQYLCYPQITDTWFPLSGGLLSIDDNPGLFAMFGFKYGQATVNNKFHFKVPSFNSTSVSDPSKYPRPKNNNNSNGRNLNKKALDIAPPTLKSHSHSGSTSADGNHAHGRAYAGYFTGRGGSFTTGGGFYPCIWGAISQPIGHGGHSHSGGSASTMILDAAHTSAEVEPKGFGAILCIHKG